MCITFPSSIGDNSITRKIFRSFRNGAISMNTGLFVGSIIINYLDTPARKLTPREVTMITSIFGKKGINTEIVRVRNGSILPLQDPDTAVTPWGEPFFPEEHFSDDFSIEPIHAQHWFMHEIVHVWQYQMGMNVAFWGAGSAFADYDYQLANDKVLSDYGMEQQAEILADYWCLKTHGYKHWCALASEINMTNINNNTEIKDKRSYWLNQYENTLKLFLQNPKDKKALFG